VQALFVRQQVKPNTALQATHYGRCAHSVGA
jgi:hypothetical protein